MDKQNLYARHMSTDYILSFCRVQFLKIFLLANLVILCRAKPSKMQQANPKSCTIWPFYFCAAKINDLNC
jgi:hypothetical protein